MSLSSQIILVLLCLVGTGLFAGLETGIISINRLRLRHLVHKNVPGSRILQKFLDHPDHLLGTTLVGTNICMVMASVAAASISARWFGAWGTAMSSVVVSLVILVGCEYIPKAWFQGRPAARCGPFAGFLKVSGFLLYPISRVVMLLARMLVPAPSPDLQDVQPFITKDELKHLTHEGEQTGELSSDERRMIHNVLELTHIPCKRMMVPRKDFVFVQDHSTADEILQIARSRNLYRLPVYSASAQQFTGVIHVFDLLRDPTAARKTARDYMRPPQFISGATPADQLMPRMRLSRQPMVLVTDKTADVIGLVTTDMLMQVIMGS